MPINQAPQHVKILQDAKFVIYKYPGSESTYQSTIGIHVDKTWEAIRRADFSGNSYGVIFEDKGHNVFPITYIIKGELKNILDLDDNNMEDHFEEAEASSALAGTRLTTYIKAQLRDLLAYIPFDPRTMVMVGENDHQEPHSENFVS